MLSPYRGRWRRWAARAERYRATCGRWLAFPPREPCWEARPKPDYGLDLDEEDEEDAGDAGDLVRAYVTAYLGERRTA
ncbi:hypothetical protein ACFU53_29845 [Streptomyces sp. NPDC057474]|uniref:hypothetical protein n=1 Tax=Streptomyces sp. NPDC057474 TaxID=3346144 RepID=UPI0036CE6F8B